MAGLEGDGQRARPPIGVRSRPRAHAHAPPLRLVPATKVRPAGSPGKAELDHEESPGLRAAGSDSASVSLAALVNLREEHPLLRPGRPTDALSVLCCQHTGPVSPPPSLGEHQEIETQAHNWKPDRFAGANGALYTRCTKVKETIMQPVQGGALLPLSWDAFHRYPLFCSLPFSPPCPPPQTQVAVMPPKDPDLSFRAPGPQERTGNYVAQNVSRLSA